MGVSKSALCAESKTGSKKKKMKSWPKDERMGSKPCYHSKGSPYFFRRKPGNQEKYMKLKS
jgi:hypothetical protein